MKRKRKFITWVSILFMVLPRIFYTYPFYGLSSVFAVRFTYRKTGALFLAIVILFFAFIVNTQFAAVSVTSFILSLVLQLPFIMFLLQFDIKEGLDGLRITRVVNVIVVVFSIINMIPYGFPFKLPYINFLPDYFAAFYGEGGAKIVTVIGFFGIAAEFFVVKERKSLFFMIAGLINFIVPNYLIGMIMGIGALTVVAIRKKPALIPLLLIIVLGVLPYAMDRAQNLNQGFAADTGMNPKVFAYYSILLTYTQFPVTVLFGTGLGCFSSTPALWASTYISALSTHGIPKMPGFFMSQYHQAVLGPILSVLVTDKWSLESSASKPYTSVSSIFNEYGLFMAVFIMVLAYNAFSAMSWKKKYTIAIACFSVFIFTTDQWHDNLFFGYFLILSRGISVETT